MTRILTFLRAFGLGTALLSLAGTERATAGPYAIDILINPYHPDVIDSWLFDINEQGIATGYVVTRPPGQSLTRAVVTYQDGMTSIKGVAASYGGLVSTAGFAINNLGDVVGNVNDEPTFMSAGGVVAPLVVPGSYASLFVAGLSPGGLNDSGKALISAYPNDPADVPPGAFSGLALWSQGGVAALTVLDPLYPYVNPPDLDDFNSGPSSSAGTSSATHLNNANQFAAGIHVFAFDPMDPDNFDDDVFTESFTHAYIYDGQGGYSLLEVPTPGDDLRPIDIDEAGTVFGWAGTHLALWNPDGSLQSILPDPATTLRDVGGYGLPSVQRNNLGQIVGVTVAGGVQFFDPIANAWSDVTPSINGLGTGTFSTIQGFNDRGQFVGLVRPPAGGGVYGYVVSPVPESGTLSLLAIALLLLVAIQRPAELRAATVRDR